MLTTQRAPEKTKLRAHNPAINATELVRTFGRGRDAVTAVNGLNLTVPAGSVFGLLGPNGAGKSTTVRILTTLSSADSGTATVAGHDVNRQPDQVRKLIGYVPQKPCLDTVATGREDLRLQGRVHGLNRRDANRRADELLERFGLSEAADRQTKTWSGGMQRKLDIALGLVHKPEVLFLDEPTTGLDPEARADLWAEIEQLTNNGLTVLLTTHYLDEADRLANRIAIVDRGRVVAEGSPDELKSELAQDTIHIELVDERDSNRARDAIKHIVGSDNDLDINGSQLRIGVSDGAATMPQALTALTEAEVPLASMTLARPSLDDVYLKHAGRSFHVADAAAKEVA